MTGRSSYKQTIQVLKAIHEGKTPSQIKQNIQLSRYTYTYIINRLRNHNLIHDENLQVSQKGLNVLKYHKTPKQEQKIPT